MKVVSRRSGVFLLQQPRERKKSRSTKPQSSASPEVHTVREDPALTTSRVRVLVGHDSLRWGRDVLLGLHVLLPLCSPWWPHSGLLVTTVHLCTVKSTCCWERRVGLKEAKKWLKTLGCMDPVAKAGQLFVLAESDFLIFNNLY